MSQQRGSRADSGEAHDGHVVGEEVHTHQNDFEHLEVRLNGVERHYDLGWKFEANTDGPPDWLGDPYLLLYISFAMTSGARRRSGTLHYALTRGRWQDVSGASDVDRDRLLELATESVPQDLMALEQGKELPWLDAGKFLYLAHRRNRERE